MSKKWIWVTRDETSKKSKVESSNLVDLWVFKPKKRIVIGAGWDVWHRKAFNLVEFTPQHHQDNLVVSICADFFKKYTGIDIKAGECLKVRFPSDWEVLRKV